MAKVYSFGERSVENIDDANVPMNIIIDTEKYSDFKRDHREEIENNLQTRVNHPEGISDDMMIWILEADNFMPRKEYMSDPAYLFMSTDRKSLETFVQKYITLLYEIALNKLKTTSENYYWSK